MALKKAAVQVLLLLIGIAMAGGSPDSFFKSDPPVYGVCWNWLR